MKLKLLDPKDVEIRPEELDYDPEVAKSIIAQLAAGINELSTWNVPGSPTANQLHSFLLENKEFYASFNAKQLENINTWIKSTVYIEPETLD
jgi:hypothetical protein